MCPPENYDKCHLHLPVKNAIIISIDSERLMKLSFRFDLGGKDLLRERGLELKNA